MDQPGTYLPYTDTYLPRVNDIGKKNFKAQKIQNKFTITYQADQSINFFLSFIEQCRQHCTLQSKYNCRSFNYNAFRKVSRNKAPNIQNRFINFTKNFVKKIFTEKYILPIFFRNVSYPLMTVSVFQKDFTMIVISFLVNVVAAIRVHWILQGSRVSQQNHKIIFKIT